MKTLYLVVTYDSFTDRPTNVAVYENKLYAQATKEWIDENTEDYAFVKDVDFIENFQDNKELEKYLGDRFDYVKKEGEKTKAKGH